MDNQCADMLPTVSKVFSYGWFDQTNIKYVPLHTEIHTGFPLYHDSSGCMTHPILYCRPSLEGGCKYGIKKWQQI